MPLRSLRTIREEMEEREWVIVCFPFRYAKCDYFVLIRRYLEDDTRPEFALVELCFVDQADLERMLCAPANSGGIIVDAKDLREYFGIQWAPNLGDLLHQFTRQLGQTIPKRLPKDLHSFLPAEQAAILHHLSRNDDEDPTKIYCFGVRRNPARKDGSPGKRTPYNSQKTHMLRPKLYEKLRVDPGLSFLYSADQKRERNCSTILAQLSDPPGDKGGR